VIDDRSPEAVMAGLDPAIHVSAAPEEISPVKENVDARVKPEHDGVRSGDNSTKKPP
jgi:hypothetical protein